MGTIDINTGDSNTLILKENTQAYVIKDTRWSFVQLAGWTEIDGSTSTNYVNWPGGKHYQYLYTNILNSGSQIIDNLSAFYLFKIYGLINGELYSTERITKFDKYVEDLSGNGQAYSRSWGLFGNSQYYPKGWSLYRPVNLANTPGQQAKSHQIHTGTSLGVAKGVTVFFIDNIYLYQDFYLKPNTQYELTFDAGGEINTAATLDVWLGAIAQNFDFLQFDSDRTYYDEHKLISQNIDNLSPRAWSSDRGNTDGFSSHSISFHNTSSFILRLILNRQTHRVYIKNFNFTEIPAST